jgi:hypothetical protein
MDVNWLAIAHVQKVKRRLASADSVQIGGILWVIEAVEWSVFNAEAIGPDVQDAALGLGVLVGGSWTGGRVWDDG